MRRIFGGFAHAAFTSLTGIGIGLIPWVSSRFLKVLLPLLGLSAAILLHATFNFIATTFGPLAYVVLLFVLLLYAVLIIVWLWIERRMIRDELREEVGAGTITAEEYSRSEEHTSELQSRQYLVCRLLLEKKKRSTTPSNRTLTT